MYQTVRLSSCVSAQGDLVENLPNGDAIVRDGANFWRGRPIAAVARQEVDRRLTESQRTVVRPES